MIVNEFPSPDIAIRAPKVLLHDHLDAGLRTETVGLNSPKSLATRDYQPMIPLISQRGSTVVQRNDLVLYLETFGTPLALCNTVTHWSAPLTNVLDLASDGVVYAEVRYAPELNVEAGLSLDEVVVATIDGFQRAEQDRHRYQGHSLRTRTGTTASILPISR